MIVHFRSSHPTPVRVALTRYDPELRPEEGQWVTEGWWALDPGQQAYACTTDNPYICYYAESDDGSIWAGDYGPYPVNYYVFHLCIGSEGDRTVGMRLVYLEYPEQVIDLL